MTETGPTVFLIDQRRCRPQGRLGGQTGAAYRCLHHGPRATMSWGQTRSASFASGAATSPPATGTARKPPPKRIVDGWLHSGDAAKYDEEGFYYIVDRWKDMFISGGENVYPAEVENVIYQHPAVAEVAVIGVPHPKWQEVGKAIVVVKEGHTLTEEEVISQFCQGKLARYKIPKSVDFCGCTAPHGGGQSAQTRTAKTICGVTGGDFSGHHQPPRRAPLQVHAGGTGKDRAGIAGRRRCAKPGQHPAVGVCRRHRAGAGAAGRRVPDAHAGGVRLPPPAGDAGIVHRPADGFV